MLRNNHVTSTSPENQKTKPFNTKRTDSYELPLVDKRWMRGPQGNWGIFLGIFVISRPTLSRSCWWEIVSTKCNHVVILPASIVQVKHPNGVFSKWFHWIRWIQWQKKIKTRKKKVLLRERKRHTARRVVSTPSVVLTGYPPSWPGRGGTQVRYPPGRVTPHPHLAGGVPYLGNPHRVPPGRVPPRTGYSPAGYPPVGYLPLAGYPPGRVPHPPPGWTWQGVRCQPHGILGNVEKHYGIWAPPCGQTDRQTCVKT